MDKKVKFINENGLANFTLNKEYVVTGETDRAYTLENNNGATVMRSKNNFEEVVNEADIIAKKNSFKKLTEGKSYKKVSEIGNYFIVINDIGKQAKYAKKYFQKPIKEVRAKVQPKPQPAPKVQPKPQVKPKDQVVSAVIPKKKNDGEILDLICKYPPEDSSLSYNKKYKVKNASDDRFYIVVADDKGNEDKVLKKRFIADE